MDQPTDLPPWSAPLVPTPELGGDEFGSRVW